MLRMIVSEGKADFLFSLETTTRCQEDDVRGSEGVRGGQGNHTVIKTS